MVGKRATYRRLTWGSFHARVLLSKVGDLADNFPDKDDITDATLDLRVRSGMLVVDAGDGGEGLRWNCRSIAFGAKSSASRSMKP